MSDRMVPRRVSHNDSTRSEAVTTAILGLVPRVSPFKAAALLAAPGQGEKRRVIVPVRMYNQNPQIERLFVAGDCSDEETWEDYTGDRLHLNPYYLARRDGLAVQPKSHAANTKEQTDWLASQFKQLQVTSTTVCVTDWHLVRLYRTLLASMISEGIERQTALLPWPIPTPPSENIPGLGLTPWGAMPGEIERRKVYQKSCRGESADGRQPDCATPVQVLDYLDWLHKHPVLQ